jgi:Zn-dependent peptidase ImmA (M78 family)
MLVASEDDVYEVVKKLKDAWNIGEDGILSVTDLLESKNIKVVEIKAGSSFDGLSGYVNNDENMPFVVVNKSFDVERLRFTGLHELGHLVMNLPEDMEKKEKERLCHLFASEMLISRDTFVDVLGERRSDISLQELKVLQAVYGISVDALMFKAKTVGVISESKHTSFCIRKNKSLAFKDAVERSSYRGVEESSRFDRLVYRALASDMISCSKAAVLLNEPMEEVKNKLELV